MSVTIKFDPASQTPQARIIGDATTSQDGVMTKAQVKQLDELMVSFGTIFWDDAKTWSDVYAEILAAGGGIVVLPYRSFREMTPGSYDLTNVAFQGIGVGILVIDDGALIDAGVFAVLDVTNLIVIASGALITPNTMKYTSVSLVNSTLASEGATVPLFTHNGASNEIDFNLQNSTVGTDSVGQPVVFLSNPSGRCFFEVHGGIFGALFGLPNPIANLPTTTYAISGVAGALFALVADAIARPQILHAVDPTLTVDTALVIPYGHLGVPLFKTGPSNPLPTPDNSNVAGLAFDVSKPNPQPQWSTGVEYRNFSAPPAFTTAARPLPGTVPVGTCIFNTTTGIPNWSTGAVWHDAAGGVV